jgi:transposase
MSSIIKTVEIPQTEYASLKSKVSELEALVKWYEEQYRLSQRRLFGASSEKSETDGQLGIFDEAENTADPKAAEPTVEEIAYTREKREGKRADDLSGLPVETIAYELSEEERVCPQCGETMRKIGKEIRRELTVIPAQVKVTERERVVCACENCEKNSDHTPVVKAAMPEPVIKGSLASPSAVAHIMTEKFVTYTPLYRQEQNWKRQGVALSRQTLANWVIRCADDWLEPLYERLRAELLKNEVLHADETTLQVLREPRKKARSESYMWLYRTSGGAPNHIALYDYQPTRSSAHPKRFLEGWTGYLHTDGYSGYHALSNLTVVGCWAHARRKFDEALTALKPEDRPNSNAQKGLDFCNRLFALEKIFENLSPNERQQAREKQSRPIAEAFFAWAKGLNVLPKSALGKAIEYAAKQEKWLMNFFLDGRLELSNNRAERSIKPFVMGRKNWLFCNTQKGARASAVVYSVIETAKENGLKPFDYLKFIFETMPNITTSQIDALLPWGETLPACCKTAR